MTALATRYGFDRVSRLGSKQCGSVTVDDTTTLYISYGTIIAYHVSGNHPIATAEKWGVTTTRQLSAMLRNDDFFQWDTVDRDTFRNNVAALGYDSGYNRAPVFFSR